MIAQISRQHRRRHLSRQRRAILTSAKRLCLSWSKPSMVDQIIHLGCSRPSPKSPHACSPHRPKPASIKTSNPSLTASRQPLSCRRLLRSRTTRRPSSRTTSRPHNSKTKWAAVRPPRTSLQQQTIEIRRTLASRRAGTMLSCRRRHSPSTITSSKGQALVSITTKLPSKALNFNNSSLPKATRTRLSPERSKNSRRRGALQTAFWQASRRMAHLTPLARIISWVAHSHSSLSQSPTNASSTLTRSEMGAEMPACQGLYRLSRSQTITIITSSPSNSISKTNRRSVYYTSSKSSSSSPIGRTLWRCKRRRVGETATYPHNTTCQHLPHIICLAVLKTHIRQVRDSNISSIKIIRRSILTIHFNSKTSTISPSTTFVNFPIVVISHRVREARF